MKLAPSERPAFIDALLQSRLTNAFAVLGPHRQAQQVRIVFFAPGADQVLWQADGISREMQQIDPAGVFSVLVATSEYSANYRLCVTTGGHVQHRDDPYRFASLLADDDVWLFAEGRHEQAWRFLGARPTVADNISGVQFAVWAPNARRVAVIGDFNHWDPRTHVLRFHPSCGIWEMFVPGPSVGAGYCFDILTADSRHLRKADPYAMRLSTPADDVALVTQDSGYSWSDQQWLSARMKGVPAQQPVSIYEVHAGSWRRDGAASYAELSRTLLDYVVDMGFTHIELMPVTEHPFTGSWGYQPLGLYAPTARYGSPDELRGLIDAAHRRGIGVILDWVPAHFPGDPHGLGRFDGSALYEHDDPRRGLHPDWGTLIYDFGRHEVISYLLSNASYWLSEFHFDGLRIDAVASMLYLDYSREDGQWLPNVHGGRENLEAIALLRRINTMVRERHPGVMTIAEESTAWEGVTRDVDAGGLGFTFKWNMGWMNDTLDYMGFEPVHRRYHHQEMTFSAMYAFNEQFILPLSHDEVVHGKASLLAKMPGDRWQQFANLRLLFGFMWGHPGKKLLFMGDEFGQWQEWNHDAGLQWDLLAVPEHDGLRRLVRDLNDLYVTVPSLHAGDCRGNGFRWLDVDNAAESVVVFERTGTVAGQVMLVAVNMTPVVRYDYQIPVAAEGHYRELLNTDSANYGGSNVGNLGLRKTEIGTDGTILRVNLPPLAVLFLVPEARS